MSTDLDPWKPVVQPSGQIYYVHSETKETSWNPPTHPKLPPNWREAETNGKRYYFNTATQATSWTRPTVDEDPWKEAKTPEGKVYYFHSVTNEVSWKKPDSSTSTASSVPENVSSPSNSTNEVKSSKLEGVAEDSSEDESTYKPVQTIAAPTVTTVTSTPATTGTTTTSAVNNSNTSSNTLESLYPRGVHRMSSPASFFIARTSVAANAARKSQSALHQGRSYSQKYKNVVDLRSSGLFFKSWNSAGFQIETTSTLQIYDNTYKKVKNTLKLNHCLAVIEKKSEDCSIISLHEYSEDTCVNNEQDTSSASHSYYVKFNNESERDIFVSALIDHGCEIRYTLWEGAVMCNRRELYMVVYSNNILFYKKQTDIDPDMQVSINGTVYFSHEPCFHSSFYNVATYGDKVPERMFVVGQSCNEDAQLYYITCASVEEHADVCSIIAELVDKKFTPLDSHSLIEGYAYKCNSSQTRWSRRYMVLRSDKLLYYRERTSAKAAGEIYLPNGFELNFPSNDNTEYRIEIAESGDEGVRIFPIVCLTHADYTMWSDILVELQHKKSAKKDAHSVYEGYVYLITKGKRPQKKFFVLRNDKLAIYNQRKDVVDMLNLEITSDMSVGEWSIMGDDGVVSAQRLRLLSVLKDEKSILTFGFIDDNEYTICHKHCKEIIGEGIQSEAVKEGFLLKSRTKGEVIENLKYFLLLGTKLYYSPLKTHILENCKVLQLCGDVPATKIDDTKTGHYGLTVANSGDDGAKVFYLYLEREQDRDAWLNAINNELSKHDWRRDKNSLKEGYLYKANSSGKYWARRYMVLTTTKLLYYRKKFDPEPAGEIPLPGGFHCSQIHSDASMNNVSKYDKTAIETAAATFKCRPNELKLWCISPTEDLDERRFWLATEPNTNTVIDAWLDTLNALKGTKSERVFPNSVIEGYLYVNGKSPTHRKYVVVFNDRITWYKKKLDIQAEKVCELPCGFDIYIKQDDDNSGVSCIYIGSEASENLLSDYTGFYFVANDITESMQHWAEIFQSLHTKRTNPPLRPVIHQSYVSIEKCNIASPNTPMLPKKIRFLVVCRDKLMVYRSRKECYINEAPPASIRASFSGVQTCNQENIIDMITFDPKNMEVRNSVDDILRFTVKFSPYIYTFVCRTLQEKQEWMKVLDHLAGRGTQTDIAALRQELIIPDDNISVVTTPTHATSSSTYNTYISTSRASINRSATSTPLIPEHNTLTSVSRTSNYPDIEEKRSMEQEEDDYHSTSTFATASTTTNPLHTSAHSVPPTPQSTTTNVPSTSSYASPAPQAPQAPPPPPMFEAAGGNGVDDSVLPPPDVPYDEEVYPEESQHNEHDYMHNMSVNVNNNSVTSSILPPPPFNMDSCPGSPLPPPPPMSPMTSDVGSPLPPPPLDPASPQPNSIKPRQWASPSCPPPPQLLTSPSISVNGPPRVQMTFPDSDDEEEDLRVRKR